MVERAVCAAAHEVAAEASQKAGALELVGWSELLAEDLSAADVSDDGLGHEESFASGDRGNAVRKRKKHKNECCV